MSCMRWLPHQLKSVTRMPGGGGVIAIEARRWPMSITPPNKGLSGPRPNSSMESMCWRTTRNQRLSARDIMIRLSVEVLPGSRRNQSVTLRRAPVSIRGCRSARQNRACRRHPFYVAVTEQNVHSVEVPHEAIHGWIGIEIRHDGCRAALVPVIFGKEHLPLGRNNVTIERPKIPKGPVEGVGSGSRYESPPAGWRLQCSLVGAI